ncbi:probable receptor-like protein kinase At1g49730 isoform X1 [Amborella trichopoda]|uniref:probable receptor-like protein kinase At1g49730 isoform X1 n=1 Tax=Amborella trichopoda TaxID=13333 RepID=UPI0009C0361E|nr:probable receptor-like protein kinase At1g49730 isoform X1 [Amborella trichopoda]|eukprot:XP_011628348.2 probable receptor-like protein kinase At1g49730 isoform X1 [Amborella trichopoda]
MGSTSTCTQDSTRKGYYTSPIFVSEASISGPSPQSSESYPFAEVPWVKQTHPSPRLNVLIGVASGIIGILIFLLLMMILLILKRRKQGRAGDGMSLCPCSSPFFRNFTCKEIERATGDFSTIIGRGSFGTVYKAQFPDGLVAAVREVRTSCEVQKDTFDRKVQFLGRLHHRHLVPLRGFSAERDRFLIMEYMENGNLKELLHDPLRTPLNWKARLQVAIDVASALDYLQSFCKPPVCNISIKSSKILLDENFVAKLSPFGFLESNGSKMTMAHLQGKNQSSYPQESVVFQYGLLLLELITGQSIKFEGINLIQEYRFIDSMLTMVDPDLGINFDPKELKILLVIARMCIDTEGTLTVSMPCILRYLQGKFDPLSPCGSLTDISINSYVRKSSVLEEKLRSSSESSLEG